ncbi:hypothetical protein ABB02_00208 [Clostridiaceae bacterium JG1575]|nr:hypothetical protein ABB02_00208 [Clostridiaceae bacterium JG1575]
MSHETFLPQEEPLTLKGLGRFLQERFPERWPKEVQTPGQIVLTAQNPLKITLVDGVVLLHLCDAMVRYQRGDYEASGALEEDLAQDLNSIFTHGILLERAMQSGTISRLEVKLLEEATGQWHTVARNVYPAANLVVMPYKLDEERLFY